jgi:large subunit ribosomal protein L13
MQRQTQFLKQDDFVPGWHHVDADGQVLGRMATRIATVLQGKHRPDYTPHVDCGDFVIVTNADKIVLTGNKLTQRLKTRWSGYPGGLKAETFGMVKQRHPERLVEDAVRRMLPKGRLGRKMFKKLKVYAGAEHPHASQRPEPMAF